MRCGLCICRESAARQFIPFLGGSILSLQTTTGHNQIDCSLRVININIIIVCLRHKSSLDEQVHLTSTLLSGREVHSALTSLCPEQSLRRFNVTATTAFPKSHHPEPEA